MDFKKLALKNHKKLQGKISLAPKTKIKNRKDLSWAYTPGVAAVCEAIAADKPTMWDYTSRGNWVAVVSDGSAVLGLGNIGPEAAMPVMEGKCVLFKEFAGLDAFPICLRTQNVDEIVATVKQLSLSFAGINLEDIAAPACFEVEARLKKELDIPVMHDDQHGTAIVATAGLINAFKITGRSFATSKFVINGVGAAGVAITKMIVAQGAKDIILVDSRGIINDKRTDLTPEKQELLRLAGSPSISGGLAEAVKGRDVFIGVSKGNVLSQEMVHSMNLKSIVFALSNPTPEIMPDLAKEAGAAVVATGRSDFPNQVNNVLAYPGIFRGAIDAKAKQITEEMKIAAAQALAAYVKKPAADKIIPDALDKKVAKAVAKAVMKAAKK